MEWDGRERDRVRARVERLKQSNKRMNPKSWHLNVHSGILLWIKKNRPKIQF